MDKIENELTLELMARSRFSAVAQYFLFTLASSYVFLNKYWQLGSTIAAILFVVVNTLRFYFSSLRSFKLNLVRIILSILILLTSLTWCLLFLSAVTSKNIDPIGVGVMVFIIAGVASSGVYSLSLSKRILVLFVLPLITSMAIPFILHYQSWERDLIPILIIGLFFVFIIGQQKKIFEAWLSHFNKNEEINLIFENSPAGMALIENNYINKANEKFYSFLSLEDKQKNLSDENQEQIKIKNFINNFDQQSTSTKSTEIELQNKFFMIAAHKINPKKNRFLLFLADIDELKQTQKIVQSQQMVLIQSSRLAALGEMSNGIAHEINNPLAIICSKAQQIHDRISNNDFTQEYLIQNLKKISDTGFRIAHIVKSLQTFSREPNNDPFELISIEQLIQDSVALCSSKINSNQVKINVSIEHDTKIKCQTGQMSQLIVNVINNAIDSTSNLSPEKRWININSQINQNQNFLKLIITDGGNGIPYNHRDRIMEPFFTTKGIGKNLGLGLSVAKGIIENHNGKIYFDFNAKVTTLIIDIPYFD